MVSRAVTADLPLPPLNRPFVCVSPLGCAEIDSDGLDAVFYVFCGPGKTAARPVGHRCAVPSVWWWDFFYGKPFVVGEGIMISRGFSLQPSQWNGTKWNEQVTNLSPIKMNVELTWSNIWNRFMIYFPQLTQVKQVTIGGSFKSSESTDSGDGDEGLRATRTSCPVAAPWLAGEVLSESFKWWNKNQ